MIEYIGNCADIIDWNVVVSEVLESEPDYIGPTFDVSSIHVSGAPELASSLRTAGHKLLNEGGSMGWSMYFPGKHFSHKVQDTFCNFVNLKSCYFCWISCIYPGHMAPWHWDITDEDRTQQDIEDIKRFHCHITPPYDAHFFVVEDRCFYKEDQGAVYKWPSRESWHAGSNAGTKVKLLFNIWGV